MGQALSFIQDLVAALLNFHSYTEQRVHIYPRDSSIEPISPLNQKVNPPETEIFLTKWSPECVLVIYTGILLLPVFSVPTWKCSLRAPPGGDLSAVTPKHHWRHCHSPGESFLCYFLCFSLIVSLCCSSSSLFLFCVEGNCRQTEELCW